LQFDLQVNMKRIALLLVCPALICSILPACNMGTKGLFSKRTEREKYEDRIEKIETPEVLAWKRFGKKVVEHPVMVPAPYAENGIFAGDSTDANAFLFTAGPGQKVKVMLTPDAGSLYTAFLELWEAGDTGNPRLIEAVDTMLNSLEFSAPQGGNFIVRMQPKLASRGRYHLKILLQPILGFPISPEVKSNIGSLWGDPRDAGVRKHEGIDIFAKKGSAAVAVTDGTVSRVSEGGIGGEVVWFNPDKENFSVYYAHLDSQYVQNGQRVKKGTALGAVGNTGNAKYTSAHLHFGIYTNSGAVNPLSFVQPVKEPAAGVYKKLNEWFKTTVKTKIYPAPLKKNALPIAAPAKIKTVSVSNDFYKVVLENGDKAFVAVNELSDKMKL
jgi:murein DD-endopeptidase MepM/ murein hydrolase activator NlpD